MISQLVGRIKNWNIFKFRDGGWCTGFPEYWYQWYLKDGKWYKPRLRKIYIGHCCKKHDNQCSTKVFIDCLQKHNVLGRYIITTIAGLFCLFKYGKV